MNLKDAKRKMAVRRDRYMVGYIGAKNLAFGLPAASRQGDFKFSDAGEPTTLLQAKRFLKKMPCLGCAMFQLVPVAVNR